MIKQKEILKRKAALGIVLLSAKRVSTQLIFTISNIFLARLLFPEDFGVFAIVIFVTTFFTVFTDLGLGPSLIQKKSRLGAKDLQTAFTLHLSLSLAIVVLIFLAAPQIANFYNLGTKGINLFRLYSLYLLFLPFRTVSGAVLERNLEYKKLVTIEVLEIAISTGITVLTALLGFGVFSFAWGAVVGHLIGAMLYFGFSPWQFELKILKKNFLFLAKFGLPFQSQAWLGLFFGPAILLYLGKVVGSQNLGYYQFAASLSVFPVAISEIVSRIVFPVGARVQEDKIFFRQIVERAILVTSLTTLPIVGLMLASAPQIVHFVYTDRWLPALPAIYLGVVQMAIIAYTGIFAQVLLSLGLATIMRNISIIWAVLTWVLALPLIYLFDFVGMSLTGLFVSITGIWLFARLKREITFSWLPYFLPYLIMAAVTGLVVFTLINLVSITFYSFIYILVFGIFFYLFLVLIFSRNTVSGLYKLFLSSIR